MEVVVTSTILPEPITLSYMLVYLEMYGTHHIINNVHKRVRPPLYIYKLQLQTQFHCYMIVHGITCRNSSMHTVAIAYHAFYKHY